MKKFLFSIITVAALAASMSSCKKCDSCTIQMTKTDYCSKDYSAAQIEASRQSCISMGGTWESE